MYEAAHPDVEITFHGGWWQAVMRAGASATVVTRFELRELLDRLDALDQ